MLNHISKTIFNIRNRHFLISDIVVFLLLPFFALLIRVDGKINFETQFYPIIFISILFTTVKVIVFYTLNLYKRYWQYASVDELARILINVVSAGSITFMLFYLAGFLKIFSVQNLPLSIPFIDILLTLVYVGGSRMSMRLAERYLERSESIKSNGTMKNLDRVIIVGAGMAGVAIVEEMQRNPQLGMFPVAYVDDDTDKHGMKIRRVPVVGGTNDIGLVAKTYSAFHAVIAMPTVSGEIIRNIVTICQKSGIKTKTIPGIYELLDGKVRIDSIRPIEIEDLLRRDSVKTDIGKVEEFISDNVVLVTGAGGSIGGELCRQIMRCRPKEIILIGNGENSIFNIAHDLKSRLMSHEGDFTKTNIYTVIADIRHKSRLDKVFSIYKPQIVFHAAAHKHVPLMEDNPQEAVTNNILGTQNLIATCLKYSVHNFVLISTDKAVNPSSIMGASKRVAEMIVMDAAKKFNKNFVAVRFGNVLGSRGSVLHTFKKQIVEGGPITITHSDITRYFMTIPEAVQLVLQASVLGKGGEIFVLDMGKPIKIYDLACDMIRLSGYEVDKDIKINVSGLRPGEKLYEELFVSGEEYKKTIHEKILIAKNSSEFVVNDFENLVESIINSADYYNHKEISELLRKIVVEYVPQVYEQNEGKQITHNS